MNIQVEVDKTYLLENGATVKITLDVGKDSGVTPWGMRGAITKPDGTSGEWASFSKTGELLHSEGVKGLNIVGEKSDLIYTESLHYAGMEIFNEHDELESWDMTAKIEAKAKDFIAQVVEVNADCYDSVQIDENYRCMSECGIGFVGRSQAHVLWVANQVAEWANNEPDLKVV